jgi:hypothetical protein
MRRKTLIGILQVLFLNSLGRLGHVQGLCGFGRRTLGEFCGLKAA